MSTVSMDEIYQTVRTRLLSYTDATFTAPLGDTLADVFRITAPDSTTGFYAVVALRSVRVADNAEQLKITASLEAMCFGRPRSAQPQVEAIGDQIVAALTGWTDGSSGLLYTTDARAESLPAPTQPADRELVQVRVTAMIKCYPVFLSRLSS